jgi:hypothetical protein
LELDKRLSAAEKVTPAGGGQGPFSEEFIASMTLFSTAANNVARVLLEYFIPAINSLTGLLIKWLAPAGSPEAKKIEQDFDKNLRQHFGVPPRWLSALFGIPGEAYYPPSKYAPRKDTGVGFLADATGVVVEDEYGVRTFPLAGAKGAAAAANVNNSRSSRSTSTQTSTVNIDTINAHLPGVTDAQGFTTGLKGAVPYLGAPFNSAY